MSANEADKPQDSTEIVKSLLNPRGNTLKHTANLLRMSLILFIGRVEADARRRNPTPATATACKHRKKEEKKVSSRVGVPVPLQDVARS